MTPKQLMGADHKVTPQTKPWWKEPYVWMVIAFYIMLGPDAVVSEDRYSEGLAIHQQVTTAQPPMQPAKTGRNHSATGGKKNEQP